MQKEDRQNSRRISVNTQASGVFASEARDIIGDHGNSFGGGVKLSVGTRFGGREEGAGANPSPYNTFHADKVSGENLSGSKDVMAFMEDQFGQQEQDERMRRKKYMDVESDYDFSFKVAIVGGKSVGKKSLVSKECEKDFSNPRLQRSNQKNEFIGINFQKKTYSVEGKKVLMEFWTAPSSESYMGLSSRMLSTTAAAVFVFNPYDKVSYDAAQRWISLFYKEYQAPGDSEPAIPYPPRVLLANLVEKDRAERKVSEQDARSYATRNGLLYHECNFRKKKDFNFLFISIAHKVLGPILSQKGAELPFAALERQVKVQVSLTAPLKLRFLQNVKSRRPNRNVATQAVDWLA